MIKCKNCSNENPQGSKFCDGCGSALSASDTLESTIGSETPSVQGESCPTCGAQIFLGQEFCDECGANLTDILASSAVTLEKPRKPIGEARDAGDESVTTENDAEEQVVQARLPTSSLAVFGSDHSFDLSGQIEIVIGRTDPVSGIFPAIDLTEHGGLDGGVSRQHAKIVQIGGYVTIEDLNSVNFTFVNNQRLSPGTPQPLKNGDQVRLGQVVLEFHGAE